MSSIAPNNTKATTIMQSTTAVRDHGAFIEEPMHSCSSEFWVATSILYAEVPMTNEFINSVANVTANLFSRLSSNGIVNFTHDCVRIDFECSSCGKKFPITYEAGAKGKYETFGSYLDIFACKGKMYGRVSYSMVKEKFGEMWGNYNLFAKNCKNWAFDFYESLITHDTPVSETVCVQPSPASIYFNYYEIGPITPELDEIDRSLLFLREKLGDEFSKSFNDIRNYLDTKLWYISIERAYFIIALLTVYLEHVVGELKALDSVNEIIFEVLSPYLSKKSIENLTGKIEKAALKDLKNNIKNFCEHIDTIPKDSLNLTMFKNTEAQFSEKDKKKMYEYCIKIYKMIFGPPPPFINKLRQFAESILFGKSETQRDEEFYVNFNESKAMGEIFSETLESLLAFKGKVDRLFKNDKDTLEFFGILKQLLFYWFTGEEANIILELQLNKVTEFLESQTENSRILEGQLKEQIIILKAQIKEVNIVLKPSLREKNMKVKAQEEVLILKAQIKANQEEKNRILKANHEEIIILDAQIKANHEEIIILDAQIKAREEKIRVLKEDEIILDAQAKTLKEKTEVCVALDEEVNKVLEALEKAREEKNMNLEAELKEKANILKAQLKAQLKETRIILKSVEEKKIILEAQVKEFNDKYF